MKVGKGRKEKRKQRENKKNKKIKKDFEEMAFGEEEKNFLDYRKMACFSSVKNTKKEGWGELGPGALWAPPHPKPSKTQAKTNKK